MACFCGDCRDDAELDVDLDAEDVRLTDGTRLTSKLAAEIVEDVRKFHVKRCDREHTR